MVRIHPHVDNAFVVAIVDAMKSSGTMAVAAGNFVEGAVCGASHFIDTPQRSSGAQAITNPSIDRPLVDQQARPKRAIMIPARFQE
ncbi:hypothetical protein L1987_51301 [Smallanthus sonchifolius]|uniref:Uncharacterized protein n=1 Tax=Smallanthus sonchifolius TaxID=185202 RepID=A0ACB9EPF8_9ASTR|nr:hypothetical protein L1987_51301 [Smallanthus sonchifolius]